MIKFGTSGWRGIIGEDFTFQNVRLVTKALSGIIKKNKQGKRGILIGYDTRFLSERFAQETAKILSDNGIKTLLANRDVPTPAISYKIINSKLDGGINFTASNNSAEYNGLKLFTDSGCTALPEHTNLLENEIDRIAAEGTVIKTPPSQDEVETVDIQSEYIKFVKTKINFDAIMNSGLNVGVDLLYGTAREYLDDILYGSGCNTHAIHNFRDPYFGGYSPQSTAENLDELKNLILEKKLDVGLATNADSDRFGVLDERGHYIHSNIIVPLLLNYLVKEKKLKGSVARSVATSHIIDHVAKANGLEVIETPVGFKYISNLFVSGKICYGGEESGGISIENHIPIKDGILACLLVTEMLAKTGKSLTTLIDEMFQLIGTRVYFKTENILLKKTEREYIRERLKEIPSKFNGKKVININQTDGVKLYLEDDSWVLIRFSGTEPKLRIYTEALKQGKEMELLKAAKEYYKV